MYNNKTINQVDLKSNNSNSSNNNNFDIFNSFGNLENLTIIKPSSSSNKNDDDNNQPKITKFIPPNNLKVQGDGIIISNDPTIIEFPKEITSDSLPCSKFLRKFLSCHSPSGYIQGLYLYGENRCQQQDDNLLNCYQIQFSSSRENRKIKMDDIERKRINKENEFYKDHIWKRRSPLIFKTQNEKEQESFLINNNNENNNNNNNKNSSKIDNQIFGYTKELYEFLSNKDNSDRISEIEVYLV